MTQRGRHRYGGLVALLTVVLAGCGSPAEPGTPSGAAGRKQPAPGNPGRIFAPDREGLPYRQVEDDIKAELTEECGGSLCVEITLKADPKQSDDEDCVFHRAEPKEVKRGGTFTFYLSNLNCD